MVVIKIKRVLILMNPLEFMLIEPSQLLLGFMYSKRWGEMFVLKLSSIQSLFCSQKAGLKFCINEFWYTDKKYFNAKILKQYIIMLCYT